MRLHVPGLIVAAMVLAGAPASAQVHITIADGRVTVSAKDATIRQILTEWARVGQTRIVNLDRLSGAPLSLELTDVPEAQALETVLRSVSGYLAAPRPRDVPNASRYDRIFLLASSSGAAARPGAPAPPPAPAFAPPPFNDEPPAVDEEVPRPPAPQQNSNVPVRGPAFATFPQPQPQLQPQAQPQASQPQAPPPRQGGTSFAAPPFGAPAGVSAPGMVVPTPQPAAPRNIDR
jgi:hypothetical protein